MSGSISGIREQQLGEEKEANLVLSDTNSSNDTLLAARRVAYRLARRCLRRQAIGRRKDANLLTSLLPTPNLIYSHSLQSWGTCISTGSLL